MPTSTWDLALAELIYYIPSAIPVFYCFYKHCHVGIIGWLFLAAFVVLQIVGAGLTVSAGEHGEPSKTAIIITSVGLSPLMIAIAGIMKEWSALAGLLLTKGKKAFAIILEIIFHVAVIAAIAIYAIGASNAHSTDINKADRAIKEWKAGICLLDILWIILVGTFLLLTARIGANAIRSMFWSVLVALPLLGMRLIYQTVATFNKDEGKYNPGIGGSIALKVVFQFLTGALVLVALVLGGLMSTENVEMSRVVSEASRSVDRVVESGDYYIEEEK